MTNFVRCGQSWSDVRGWDECHVRFGRGEHGAVTVIVAEEHEPLDQLLRSDVRDNRTMLSDILEHARAAAEKHQ